MRARTLVLFLVALTLAGGTAILIRSFLAQKNGEVEAQALARPAAAQKFVLVAKGPITRGQILKPQDFAWQVWPEGGIDKNYILTGTRTAENFAGWVARDPFTAGERCRLNLRCLLRQKGSHQHGGAAGEAQGDCEKDQASCAHRGTIS